MLNMYFVLCKGILTGWHGRWM